MADTLRERTWRLLNTGFTTGAMNMAIDEAILTAHSQGQVPPTLRFYGWQPPCVSIGYFQRMAAEVDLTACRRQGFDVVRRITGGRAILHHSEVTYSVVIREELLPGSIDDTYRLLADGLLAGMQHLGLAAEMAVGEPDPRLGGVAAGTDEAGGPGAWSGPSPACFDVPSAHEIVTGGAKVVGSAQTRRDGTILQHGSVLLDIDPEQVLRVLQVPADRWTAAVKHLASRAIGVRQALEIDLPWTEVRDALADGFRSALGLTLAAERLTAAEQTQAGELARDKYGSDTWNLRR